MPTIFIDQTPYEVRDGLNLLQACLELGIDLPFFCWHQGMGSVGACRQCAVKQFRDENDTRGRIVMACMTPAADKTRISIFDPEAVEFRASITEWLMENHPHDCPVCDEGGECHLQDMTVMTGHNYRRYRGKKRTFHNQNLGPLVNHEMNRCIQCYRCVRYYRDIAGGRDFNAYALHDTVYFGRAKDGVLESEFSGNLVEVCPTGVFTDKTLKQHYTRKWDLQTAPSICVHCAVGCNTIPGVRYGTLRRILNRYNGDVNGYFLCDRGRYGYEFVNSDQRVRTVRWAQTPGPLDHDAAVERLAGLLAGSTRVMGIGSPQASLESNFALRTLVGAENYYQGVSAQQYELIRLAIELLQAGPARSASLHDVMLSDAVLVLGEDVSNTAPMIALGLRQAVRQKPIRDVTDRLHIPAWDDYSIRAATHGAKGPLFLAVPTPTRIDDIATSRIHGAPQDLARLGFAVAHELSAAEPQVQGFSGEKQDLVKAIAQSLLEAEHPLVLSGTGLGSPALLRAAAAVTRALAAAGKQPQLSLVVPECNSLGLGLMGGGSLEDALQAAHNEPPDTLIILENDLYRRERAARIDELLGAAKNVVVLGVLESPTTKHGGLVLPAAAFAEASGAYVNNEGRVQRFYQVGVPEAPILESWRWIRDVLGMMARPEGTQWQNLDALQAALAQALPVFKPLLEVAPSADYRIAGAKIPREPARFSGRTAMFANRTVHEPMPPADPDSPLDFSMEGAELDPPRQPPPALIPRIWAPGWNSVQALHRFQEEIAGPLRGGNPGRRLIEPGGSGSQPDEKDIPNEFNPADGEWLVLPLYHVFGSDPLSMLSPGVAQLAPQPYLAINPQDAAAVARAEAAGEMIFELTVDEELFRLPVRLMPELPRGVVGLPDSLPGLPLVNLPGVGRLARAAEGGQG